MRLRLIFFALLALVISACQGPPPTVIYVVLSPTPNATEAAQTPPEQTTETTADITEAATTSAPPPTSAIIPSPMPTALAAGPTQPPVTAQAQSGATATPSPLPPNFPTPVQANIQYAEQLFENGRMFWLQPIGQIWVLVVTDEGRGTWSIYPDNFVEGDPETDPAIVPPSDDLQQPIRGFGMLWRENDDVREALGWAVQDEVGYVAPYEYHAGGSVDSSGDYVAAPGYHTIYSFRGERFRLNETDATWQLGG